MLIQACDFCGTQVARNMVDHTTAVQTGNVVRCACPKHRDIIDKFLDDLIELPETVTFAAKAKEDDE